MGEWEATVRLSIKSLPAAPSSGYAARMPLPADYHMHTPLCRHAKGEPTEYAAQALEIGESEIGFSDHSPMREDGFDEWRMRARELPEYFSKLEQAQKEHPTLSIRHGLEVDFLPGQESWIREMSDMHDWDYFIGSVHYVGDWAIDDPETLNQWKNSDTMEVWTAYFRNLTAAAATGLFQIMGHADLPKKFGFVPEEDCEPLYCEFLIACADTDTCIELNTAGLRKECAEIYPHPAILKRAREIGVHITFGSDAHAPHEVGADLEQAIELARECGFQDYCRFEKRQKIVTPI